ncbi:MAG TPA: DNA recombination protein RmuC, partial [Pelobium sp.]
MDLILLIAALVILLVAIFVFLKKPAVNDGVSLDEYQSLKTQIAVAEQRLLDARNEMQALESNYNGRLQKLESEKASLLEQVSFERQEVAKMQESAKAQQQLFELQKEFIAENQSRFSKDFELMANEILKRKSAEFTEVNRTNLDLLLNPLKENIKAFEDKVEKVYDSEATQRNLLRGEITKMMELNKQISDEANNLTKALKGD